MFAGVSLFFFFLLQSHAGRLRMNYADGVTRTIQMPEERRKVLQEVRKDLLKQMLRGVIPEGAILSRYRCSEILVFDPER